MIYSVLAELRFGKQGMLCWKVGKCSLEQDAHRRVLERVEQWQETERVKEGRRKGSEGENEDHSLAFYLLDMLRIWQCSMSRMEKMLLGLEHSPVTYLQFMVFMVL